MEERKRNGRASRKRKTAQSTEQSGREELLAEVRLQGVVTDVDRACDENDSAGSESARGWRPPHSEEDAPGGSVLPKQEQEQEQDQDDGGAFGEPIPLDGIPMWLRAKMYELAPMLQGRDVQYSETFFHKVVGLCNEGCDVDKALNETEVTAEEVAAKWRPAVRAKHRFPIAHATDPEQAALFTEHFRRVYGGRPDNESFSLKFLAACFATFVHNRKVNWAAEAQKRRQSRAVRSARNPRKLRPMAMREQVRALCSLLARYAQPSGHCANSESELAAKQDLHACSNAHISAEEGHTELLERLREARIAFTGLCSEEERLEHLWGITTADHRSLKQQGLVAQATEKSKEARVLLCKMKEHSDKKEIAESEMKRLEGQELPAVEQRLKDATENLLAAKEKSRLAGTSNVILHPRQAFPVYPAGRSIPRIMSEHITQLCCNCNLGFLSRSFVSASCGCVFHPPCFAGALQEGSLTCPRCRKEFDGPMLAQWGFALTKKMESDVHSLAQDVQNQLITGTTEVEPQRQGTMDAPVTQTGSEIPSHAAPPAGTESLKPETPCSGINVSIKSRSPGDMNFRVSTRGREVDAHRSPKTASLTASGYSFGLASGATIEVYPQGSECNTGSAAGPSSQALDGDGEKIQITISRICGSS